ncbi:MAG: ATP-binding protein [Chlorobi bacterium]|nr:ATP-binding protein [Chlorobiota bacterium]
MKNNINIKNLKTKNYILLHSIIGIFIGYLILHPLTMVIYWFEFNPIDPSLHLIFETIGERLKLSFSLHMMPMAVTFATIGGLTGIGSGLYKNAITKNKQKLKTNEKLLSRSISKLISDGENNHVEFKSSLRYDYRRGNVNKSLEDVILKSIAGFLNGEGGILLLGVDDDGKIIGLADDYFTLKKKNKDGFQQRIMQMVAYKFGAYICPLLHINFHEIAIKEICSIFIETSKNPVYFKEGERTIFYLRTGNVTKPLNTRETVNYLASKE